MLLLIMRLASSVVVVASACLHTFEGNLITFDHIKLTGVSWPDFRKIAGKSRMMMNDVEMTNANSLDANDNDNDHGIDRTQSTTI